MTTTTPSASLFSPQMLLPALGESVRKLDPRAMARNPVMFVVEVGALLCTVMWLLQIFGADLGSDAQDPTWFTVTVAVWLWPRAATGSTGGRS